MASDVVLSRLLQQVSDSDLFLAMLNHGNFIEIAAELRRIREESNSESLSRWTNIANAVTAIYDSTQFHLNRAKILQPFIANNQVGDLIFETKQLIASIGGAPAVSPSDISWDAVSYKIPYTSIELMCQSYPSLLTQLSVGQMAMLDQIETICYECIKEKCSEFRVRTSSIPDEFIDDTTIFLESTISGGQDPSRRDRIESIGKGKLLKYLDRMQALFAAGHLPGAIPPAKIFACQDIKSITALRSQILNLATQHFQEAEANPNDPMRPIEFEADQQQPLLEPMMRGYGAKAEGIQKALNNAIGGTNVAQKELKNQLAGGSNDIAQSLDLAHEDIVLNTDGGQDSKIREQVALLLACLRVRLDAVQESPFELVTSEDLDHLELVKVLTREFVPTLTDDIYRMAEYLLSTYSEGHNVLKYSERTLPPELVNYINYCIQGKIDMLLKAAPAIQKDAQLTNRFKKYMFMAMTLRHRVQFEIDQRHQRRIALSTMFD